MRIAVLHNRYHVTSGPERYLFEIQASLAARGHEVIPFSVRYAQNRSSAYERYFVPPPGGSDAIYYRDVRGPIAKARLFWRSVYSPGTRRRMARLIAAEHPDLAYVLIIANVLSPSALAACRDAGLPVVMRLSDYHLLVPCYAFFDGREICELCLHGSRLHAVRKRCLQNSALVSLGRIAGMAVHDRLRLYDAVDRFIAPSRFMYQKMVEAGTAPERLVHIPSFTDLSNPVHEEPPGDTILYSGRISPEKGLAALLAAYRRAGAPGELRIAGNADTPEGRRLQAEVARHGPANVRFLGACSREQIIRLMAEARLVAVPSIWYENLPLAALEAAAAGRAVVGHDVGSMPEAVEDGTTGFLAPLGAIDELAARIRRLMDDRELAAGMGRAARLKAEREFHPDAHVDRLLALWEELARGRGGRSL